MAFSVLFSCCLQIPSPMKISNSKPHSSPPILITMYNQLLLYALNKHA
jgi:hypothetical protein